MRINQTFLQPVQGFSRMFLLQTFLRQFHTGYLILGRHFSFTTFPRMEDPCIQQLASLFIFTNLIQQSYLFQIQIISLGNQLRVLSKESQTFCMRTAKSLIQLIKLHQHTGIGWIQSKGFFHALQCLFRTLLLIEISQSQVTPCGRELIIQFNRSFPFANSQVILTFVIPQIAQIIMSFGILWVILCCTFQRKNIFQTIRETIIRTSSCCILECFFLQMQTSLYTAPADIIMSHRSGEASRNGLIQDINSLFPTAGSRIVQCQFMIVVSFLTHQLLPCRKITLRLSQKETFIKATEIEAIQLQWFCNQLKSFFRTVFITQNYRFQMTCLMVMPVSDQWTVCFLQCIIPTTLQCWNLGAGKITCILPGSIPTSLIEAIISLIIFTLIFQDKSQVVQRLTIIRIRITLQLGLYCLTQISLSLLETSFSQIP